jgi:hypothetical protein
MEAAVFAGGEIDDRAQGFSYLGLEVSEKVYENMSLAGRLMPNFLTYKYRSGGRVIRAISPGLYTLAGVKFAFDQTAASLFGGIEYRHTRLDPDQRGDDLRGDNVSGLVQGDFDHWFPTRTNVNLFVSYAGTSSFVYERARIRQQLTNFDFKSPNTFNVGVEQIVGRNAEFTQVGGGIVLEMFNIPNWLGLGLRGGYKHDTNFGHGGYGALEFYKRF